MSYNFYRFLNLIPIEFIDLMAHYYYVLLAMADTEIQEKLICAVILKHVNIVKHKAKDLLDILDKKGKISKDETTHEEAMASASLRTAIIKWCQCGLSKSVDENWTDQTIMPDFELYNNHNTKSLREFCQNEFKGDEVDANLAILQHEKKRIYPHLYYVYKIIVANFNLKQKNLS